MATKSKSIFQTEPPDAAELAELAANRGPAFTPKTQRILEDLAVSLQGGGALLVGMDDDDKGADDQTGQLLEFSGDAISQLLIDGQIPPLPEALAGGINGKLGLQGRFVLLGVKIGLGFAQNQVTGHAKAYATFRYINQAITSLLAGRPVPAAPASIAAN